MKRACCFLLASLLAGCATSERERQRSGADMASRFEVNVVAIEACWDDEKHDYKDSTGLGFIVGKDGEDELVYIATPHHVVAKGPKNTIDDPEDDNPADVIGVRFHSERGERKGSTDCATGFETSYPEELDLRRPGHDLVVLKVKRPDRLTALRTDFMVAEEPKIGTKVWIVGDPERLDPWYASELGEVNKYEAELREERKRDSPYRLVDKKGKLDPGQSGAPLLSEKGLVGMAVGTGTNDSRFLPIQKIKDLLDEANVPEALTTFEVEEETATVGRSTWLTVGGVILGGIVVGVLANSADSGGASDPTCDDPDGCSVRIELPRP